MTDRWRQVEAIFHDVLARTPGDRAAFLDEVCAGDERLRAEVVSLLGHDASGAAFLETPPSAGVESRVPFAAGRRLGQYEIAVRVGSGGMSDVYRARDVKLDRDVALKVLPDGWALDASAQARFEREARALAALNHPNIAQIHDAGHDGVAYLVMEYVDGPTLADLLIRGRPMSLDRALPVARQIAEALEAAHDAGIVHRDLKPANIKVRDDGVVKVLDFGLAKALTAGAPVASAREKEAPTGPGASPAVTSHGVIVGTAAYMSPEQAEGKAADRRSDVWAFGVVLYEMLTGQRAFAGASTAEVLEAVRTTTPSLSSLPAGAPEPVRRLLGRCLERDRRERLSDIGSARLELRDALAALRAPSARSVPAWRHGVALVGLVAVVAGLTAGAVLMLRRGTPSPATSQVVRFAVPLPAGLAFSRPGRHVVAVSPDGSRVAFVASQRLFLRAVGSGEAHAVPGVLDPMEPSFSPDGQRIAYYASGRFFTVDLAGGVPVEIVPASAPYGASWTGDELVFAQDEGISGVSLEAGRAALLVRRVEGERLASPQLLPGRRALLYTRARAAASGEGFNWTEADIVHLDLASGAERVIVRGGADGRYVSTGHLVYARGRDVVAVPFDRDALAVVGSPVTIAAGVADGVGGLTGAVQFGVSEGGTFAFVAGTAFETELSWSDFRGRRIPVTSVRGWYGTPAISPDGARLAVSEGPATGDLAVLDLVRHSRIRVTSHPATDLRPLWTSDGRRVVFQSDRDGGVANLFSQAADGSGEAERLRPSVYPNIPGALTPDGRTLIYTERHPDSGADILAIAMGEPRTPQPLVKTPFHEERPALSPDGRWLAYQTDEQGRFDVHVRPYPETDRARFAISPGGGTRPAWAPDGRALYYLRDDTIYRVDVTTRPAFRVSPPRAVLRDEAFLDTWFEYAVAPDGTRFVIVTRVADTGLGREVGVVINWPRLLAD